MPYLSLSEIAAVSKYIGGTHEREVEVPLDLMERSQWSCDASLSHFRWSPTHVFCIIKKINVIHSSLNRLAGLSSLVRLNPSICMTKPSVTLVALV